MPISRIIGERSSMTEPEPQRWDDTTYRPQRRIRHGIDALTQHSNSTARTPLPSQHLNPVEHEACDQKDDGDPEGEVDDAADSGHGAQLWL